MARELIGALPLPNIWRATSRRPSDGLALCSLPHTLFDLGVLGLGPDLRIQVSRWYVARSAAGQAIDALHGKPVALSRLGHSAIDAQYIHWHQRQVFKRPAAQAA